MAELLERLLKLDLEPRVRAEVLAQVGDAYNRAGRQPQALEPFAQTAEAARENGWSDLLVAAALRRWGQSPFRASRDHSVRPLLDEALALESEIEPATYARLLVKRAAFNLFAGDLVERDEVSAQALELVGESRTPERLEVLEARWMAIACPATVFRLDALDAEIHELRKELGVLTTDACAPEISLYWQGNGAELDEISVQLWDDPRQRREVDQWRMAALSGMTALFQGSYELARSETDRALPLGREPWGEAGQVVHGLVHLLIDVIEERPAESLERWRSVAEMVPSDAMRATQAWVEALAGDAEIANGLLDRIRPRFSRLPENFIGGFGLVGFAEAAVVLDRSDLFDDILAVLDPLSDRMMGHPWAPSFAAGDVAARISERRGDTKAAKRQRAVAAELYQKLGAPALLERMDH